MKNKTFLAVSLFSFLLAGCGSTSKSGLPGPEFNGHPLQIASTDTYEWDTDKSFALNIAEMSRPAGVGYGLVDVEDPKKLGISRSGNSLVSGALGFMAGGLGGTFGYLSMDAQSDEKRDWRPSIITFYDESELDLSDPVKANKLIRNDVGKKIADGIISAYPESKYVGTTFYFNPKLNSALTLINGDICQQAFEFGRIETSEYENDENLQRFRNLITDQSMKQNDACMLMFSSKVVGVLDGKVAVVSEVANYNVSLFLAFEASKNIQGAYVLVPDMISYRVFGNNREHSMALSYPVVLQDGNEYLFDASETSSGIN